jgi:hypothetical protein
LSVDLIIGYIKKKRQEVPKSEIKNEYNRDWCGIDDTFDISKMCGKLQKSIFETLHMQGRVVGISDGIHLSVVLPLIKKTI